MERRFGRLSISTSVLASIYALQIIIGIYAFSRGQFTVVRGVILVLSIITVVALTRPGPRWMTLVGQLYGGMFVLIGVAGVVLGLRSVLQGDHSTLVPEIIGIAFGGIGAWTIVALRKNSPENDTAPDI